MPKMTNRTDIKNFITDLEAKFPVNSWQAGDIHLWPMIRMELYFHLIGEIEGGNAKAVSSPSSVAAASFLSKLKTSIKRNFAKAGIILNYFSWLRQLPKKKYLFVASDAHRVNHNGKRYNRFFDVLIELYRLESDTLYIEYDNLPVADQFNPELIRKYQQAYMGYFYAHPKTTLKLEWPGYGEFLEFLAQSPRTAAFGAARSVDRMENWFSIFSMKVDFFTAALKKIQPEKVLILCYYSPDIMALTVAANKLGINTVEMQHGPQAEIHLAYGNWSAVPATGYDMLPRTYWCWDEDSESVISQWTSKNSLYATKVIGNPWIDHWKGQRSDYPHSDYILYSLQPHPVSIPALFPPSLIDFIKTGPYKWFLRLHPRQMIDKEKIQDYLKEHGILDMVNIEDATNDPLPLLLSKARLHVTHFSGTAIEAALFNVFTVLINKMSTDLFPELIARGKAQYLDVSSEDFRDALTEAIKAHPPERQQDVAGSGSLSQKLFG
jgi:hypothetical protein